MTKSGPWLSSKPSLGNSVDCILAVLNNSSAEEVIGKPTAFPEFGVDIVLHHKHGTILVFYTFLGGIFKKFSTTFDGHFLSGLVFVALYCHFVRSTLPFTLTSRILNVVSLFLTRIHFDIFLTFKVINF